jgi:hypothetical protein
MKTPLKSLISCALILGVCNLTAVSGLAAERASPVPAAATSAAPQIVSVKKSLSVQELARYQQKAANSKAAVDRKAAGADDHTTTWIIVGVVVVAGVIALAAGGGGGGMGGY